MKYLFYSFLPFTLLFIASQSSAQDTPLNATLELADTSQANQIYLELGALIDKGAFDEGISKAIIAEEIYRQNLGRNSKELADILHKKGLLFYYKNDLENARQTWEECVSIRERLPGSVTADIAKTCNNIGSIYYSTGDYENARKQFEKALNITIEILGKDHPSLSDYYFNLGTICRKSGSYEQAVEYSKLATRITKKKYEGEHPDLAECYKELGNAFCSLGRYDTAFYYLNEGLSMMVSLKGENSPELWFYFNDLGYFFGVTGQPREALKYYNRAIELLSKEVGESHPEIASILINRGGIFNTLGDQKSAIAEFEKAIKILYQTVGKDHPSVNIIYNNLAIIYNEQGDSGRALEYFEKSLSFYYKNYDSDHPFIPLFLKNIGLVLQEQSEYEAAMKRFNEALNIQEQRLGINHLEVATIYSGMASNFFLRDSINKAVEVANKAIEISQIALDGKDHPNLVPLFQNIGVYEAQLGNREKSRFYLGKAAAMSRRLFGDYHPKLARAYRTLGKSYREAGAYEEATEYLFKALQAIGFKEELQEREGGILSSTELIKIFDQKGKLERDKYFDESAEERLLASYQWYEKARGAIKQKLQTVSKSSKLELTQDAHEIFCNATKTNLLLHQWSGNIDYLTEAFTFSEHSKSMLLYEAMQEADALQVAGIPDSLLSQEYDLRVDIAYYEKTQQELLISGKSNTDTELLIVRDTLFSLNRKMEALKDEFETVFPKYYRAKYSLPTVKVADVQQEVLDYGQSLVEYMVGDSAIYIFLIKADSFEVLEVKKDFPLDEWVGDMTTRGIYGFYTLPQNERSNHNATESIHNYTIAAQKLYEKLWTPIADKVTERVIIIPDGVLGYLPFEALLEGAPPREGIFSKYPYLIFRHQLSYSYSATLLKEMQGRKVEGNGQMLAMAPFYSGDTQALSAYVDSSQVLSSFSLRDSLSVLPASGEEVAVISELWDGKAVYGDTASLVLFKKLAPRFSLLHLSTHGKADDRLGDYAYLALGREGTQNRFEKLYARDLYNIRLNAEMVFLSACETSIGRLRRGEGIVSLARAFAYAGAKSMITTLWKVEDEKAKMLSIKFYGNLLKGISKDRALRQAKLNYLNEQKGRGAGAHPFFWAGFIGIGDMGAIR